MIVKSILDLTTRKSLKWNILIAHRLRSMRIISLIFFLILLLFFFIKRMSSVDKCMAKITYTLYSFKTLDIVGYLKLF